MKIYNEVIKIDKIFNCEKNF